MTALVLSTIVRERRIAASLSYGDAEQACGAAFIAGPVALAWARFDDNTRARVRRRYLDAIAAWRDDRGYRVPAEFVIVSGRVPVDAAAGR